MYTAKQRADALRILSMDAVQAAKSGHPGMPMGMADIAQVLWQDHLSHNPSNPDWVNRDRFVLSNGHGSALLYSLLHLTGYDLPLEELKAFRQLHSQTPGHPERGYTKGVETTTGPLGQGIANAVGFALAESMLSATFNKPDFELVNHYTYCFVGDGCLMEGISHEVASLAGTWGLNKLIVFYDDNGISIDGHVEGWYTEDTPARFKSYGWNVIPSVDGHSAEDIDNAIVKAKTSDKPTLICCKTTIGKGSINKAGTHECHGAPLGDDEIALVKAELGVENTPFTLPQGMKGEWDASEAGAQAQKEWDDMFSAYAQAYPSLAAAFSQRQNGDMPENWAQYKQDVLHTTLSSSSKIASRKASENMINLLKPLFPELIGGSADLAPSNLTRWKEATAYSQETPEGQYVHYGVREFGMAAIANGIAAYGSFKVFTATFLMFMEYARNAVRMAALMKLPTIYVFTHDSIGLGEDGPTHQPVEQIASLRATPNLETWRPSDDVETAAAWLSAVEQTETPTALCLSRQGLPPGPHTPESVSLIEKGAYVLYESGETPDVILMASGSEVSLALEVASRIETEKSLNTRVVSVPCMERFNKQDGEYKASVLPDACRQRYAIEAGVSQSWHQYVGIDGKVFGIDTFGESGPAAALYEHFGLTTSAIFDDITG